MNAIELLETQHRDVDELFARFERNRLSHPARRTLFSRLADNLAVHASLEELHFYPAVRARRTEDLLLESLEEHLGIKRLLVDLLQLDVRDETFDAKLKVLQEQVQHHVAEERAELFPKVRRLFDADQLEALGQLMISTMVELEKGQPRKGLLGQTLAAPSLTGLHGARGGHLGSRLFPRVARWVSLPLAVTARLRSLARFVRGQLTRQPLERA